MERMQRIVKASVLYRALFALCLWFGRQWQGSGVIQWFPPPPTRLERAESESSIFTRLWRRLHRGLSEIYEVLHLRKLFAGSVFQKCWLWAGAAAALAPILPNGGKGVMLIDCGANVECTSEYLLQFAFMGSFYSKHILGCANPRVGLLNNGTEETKGTELQKQAYTLLKRVSDEGRINFIGNIEGSAALSGEVDVIVTDGFTGNIMLKSCEGMIKFLMGQLKGVFLSSTKNKLAALTLKGDFAKLKDMMDVNKVGGTALLGISKPVIKAHGSSNDEAIFSAIRQAVQFARAGVIEEIEKNIDYMRLPAGAAKTEE